jgi:hypothetical protein
VTIDSGTTWKATRADVRRVIDLADVDQDGLRPDLVFAASLAACRATPGSWWTDNVTVYVTRADAAAVTDANSRALLMTGNSAVMRGSTGGHMYVSGFDVMGSIPLILQTGPTWRFVAEDCTFRYSSGDDGIVMPTKNMWAGVTILNLQAAAFVRCDASANQGDGFNSHINAGVQAFVFTMTAPASTMAGRDRRATISSPRMTAASGSICAAWARAMRAARWRSSTTTR